MPRPKATSKTAARVKSRINCEAMERGLLFVLISSSSSPGLIQSFSNNRRGSRRRACLVRFKNVADAPNCVNEFRLERIVHFGSQPAHDHINHVGGGFEPDIPNLFGDLGARNDFAGRANQMGQKHEFLWREVKRDA